MAATPILIFGLSRGVFHHGALGIARSAGRLGVPVHRIGLDGRSPISLSRYLATDCRIRPTAGAGEIMESLAAIRRRIGPALLVAVDDAATVFVDEHADLMREKFLFPRQPAGLASRLSSKSGLYEICQEHAVPTPHCSFPRSEDDVRALTQTAAFPIVAKCINAGEAPADAPRVVIAESDRELVSAYRQIQGDAQGARPNVLLQEYVPGSPETIWMFNGYFDADSVCRLGFTGRKIRQSPPYTGATTLGECVLNETVHSTTVRLMAELGYQGVLDLGYRYDERDGQYKLLDVNPRIGGTFRLFVGSDGTDVLRAMYRDLTGEDVPASRPSDGRRWLVEPLDIASSWTYLRRGDITPGDWLRSLRGIRECAWFASDDPLPFIAVWPWVLADRFARLARR